MDTQRVSFLKVPIDIVPPEELHDTLLRLLPSESADPAVPSQSRDIVLLSLADLLRARRKGKYQNYVNNAALVIPISKCIVSGIKFLTRLKAYRYMPFNFVISLLSFLEQRERTLYLLGGSAKVLRKTEKNIRSTFPNIQIVGRHQGSIKKREKVSVLQAIRKSSPSLLLAAKGVKGEELWLAKNSSVIGGGMHLWCSDLFEVFAKKRKRPSDTLFNVGLETVFYAFRDPVKFLRIFSYMRYLVLLLFYKTFRRSE